MWRVPPPPPMKGGLGEMGLIKGVGQGKGGSVLPAKPTNLPIHNVITMACWEWGKSRAESR